MSKLFLLLVFVLLGAALLQFFFPPTLWLWMISIVTVEAGHYFALLSLFLLGLATLFRFKNLRLIAPLLVVAAALYLVPLLQFAGKFHDWRQQFNYVFGQDLEADAGSVARLFTGGIDLEYQPEHHETRSKSGEPLAFDYYGVADKKNVPWVLVIPGGSWSSLNREDLWEWNAYLAKKGYAVVVASYRLLPKWSWPAQRDDIESIVEYVRAHATELGVDPNRWVILGRSAGGQIAASVAYGKRPAGLKGCIFIYAPADLTFAYRNANDFDLIDSRVLIPELLGGLPEERPDIYNDASPINAVSAGAVPALLVHGAQDPLVWSMQSQRFFGSLSQAKVPVVFMNLPWATHGFDYLFSGPGSMALRYGVDRFLRKTLN